MLNKGAMFGLDARIALAIFGALSVISGAALYSAIQESQVTAVITDLNEFTKSYEQYLLDTGVELPQHSTSKTVLNATKLHADTVDGWNGPYVPYTKYNASGNIYGFIYDRYPDLLGIYLRVMSDDSWGTNGAGMSGSDCSSSTCYIWSEVTVPESIGYAIDKKIDGTLDSNNGDIRLYTANTGVAGVYMKMLPSPTIKTNQ